MCLTEFKLSPTHFHGISNATLLFYDWTYRWNTRQDCSTLKEFMFKSEDPVCSEKTNQVSKTFVNVASLGTWTSLSKLNWKLWRLALITESDFHNHSIRSLKITTLPFKAFFVWNKFQCKSWVLVPGLLTIKYIIMYFCLVCNNLLHSDHHTNPWASSNFRAMTPVFLPCGHNGLMVEFVNQMLWYYPLNETFLAMYYFFSVFYKMTNT